MRGRVETMHKAAISCNITFLLNFKISLRLADVFLLLRASIVSIDTLPFVPC